MVQIAKPASASTSCSLSTDLAAKLATASWSTYSDAQLKTNIRPFNDSLDVLNQLNPVAYELNGLGGLMPGVTGIGLVAQDVAPVMPYAVNTAQVLLHPADTAPTSVYTINNGALTYVLVNSVKQLEAQSIQPTDVSQPLICNESTRGQHFFVLDDLLGDREEACGMSAAGVFSFHTITQF